MTVAEPEAVDDQVLSSWPYRYEIVDLGRLTVDHKYQRSLTSLVDRIAEEFNPAMVGCLIVSERENGRLAVVDGQTRFRGAEKSGKVDAVPCLIYEGLTVADEARLFAALQRNRRNIATHERFSADLVAKEPMAMEIAAILKEFGLKVGGKSDELKSVAALESVWKREKDGELLRRTIHVLQTAWPRGTVKDVYGADLIRGVARFLQGSGIDDKRLIARLERTNPGQLKVRASNVREGKGGGGNASAHMAEAILTEYSRRG
jgi:hypothetical protein